MKGDRLPTDRELERFLEQFALTRRMWPEECGSTDVSWYPFEPTPAGLGDQP